MIYSRNPFGDNFAENMEIAKILISNWDNVDVELLTVIASERSQPDAARIAACYTLGFTDWEGVSKEVLERIVTNEEESETLRDYAGEALEAVGDEDDDEDE